MAHGRVNPLAHDYREVPEDVEAIDLDPRPAFRLSVLPDGGPAEVHREPRRRRRKTTKTTVGEVRPPHRAEDARGVRG